MYNYISDTPPHVRILFESLALCNFWNGWSGMRTKWKLMWKQLKLLVRVSFNIYISNMFYGVIHIALAKVMSN